LFLPLREYPVRDILAVYALKDFAGPGHRPPRRGGWWEERRRVWTEGVNARRTRRGRRVFGSNV
jgi:hypothetical protein